MAFYTHSITPHGATSKVRMEGRRMELKGDGLVGRAETGQKSLDLTDIRDPRIADFLRTGEAEESLGKGWRVPETQVSPLSPDCKQWLHVNRDASTVTIETSTAWPTSDHHIQAHFDPASGKVNPKTIVEFYISRCE